jgi:hypothetical protein
MANFVLQCGVSNATIEVLSLPLAEIPCQGGKNNIERPQAWYTVKQVVFFSVEVYQEIP